MLMSSIKNNIENGSSNIQAETVIINAGLTEEQIADKLLSTVFYELNEEIKRLIHSNQNSFLQYFKEFLSTISAQKYHTAIKSPDYQYICRQALIIAMKASVLVHSSENYNSDTRMHKMLARLLVRRIKYNDNDVERLRSNDAIFAMACMPTYGLQLLTALYKLILIPKQNSWQKLEQYFTKLDETLKLSVINHELWGSNIGYLRTLKLVSLAELSALEVDNLTVNSCLKLDNNLYDLSDERRFTFFTRYGHGYSNIINNEVIELLRNNCSEKISQLIMLLLPIVQQGNQIFCAPLSIDPNALVIAESYCEILHNSNN